MTLPYRYHAGAWRHCRVRAASGQPVLALQGHSCSTWRACDAVVTSRRDAASAARRHRSFCGLAQRTTRRSYLLENIRKSAKSTQQNSALFLWLTYDNERHQKLFVKRKKSILWKSVYYYTRCTWRHSTRHTRQETMLVHNFRQLVLQRCDSSISLDVLVLQ